VLLSFPQSSSLLSGAVPKAALSVTVSALENRAAQIQAAAVRPTAFTGTRTHKQYKKTNSGIQHLRNLFLASLTLESPSRRGTIYSSHAAPNAVSET